MKARCTRRQRLGASRGSIVRWRHCRTFSGSRPAAAVAGGCREEDEVDCSSCAVSAIPVARLVDIWPPLYTKINTDSAQNTMTERQRDAQVGGAENQADDGGVPVSVNRPQPT